ncbi:MAG TPA: arginine--tRNA ligase [Solirubrobacteraceae bacterium]|nr:arginine--tRNA ligase [Solirubrobacteraceae bacterium]
MPNPRVALHERLQAAFSAVTGNGADPIVRRSQHADYQANGALAAAKASGRKPRDVAAEVLAAADLSDLCTNVEISGPGFINLTLDPALLGASLERMAAEERFGIAPPATPEPVVVDYSAPNAAKEMHVGHLRSTIIGDAVVRLLEWQGQAVVRENHVGDWGTPFGMLVEHLVDLGEAAGGELLSVGDLNAFYQQARAKFDADEAFKARARRRVVALQSGDEETLRLWRVLVEQSERYFVDVYELLDVTLTHEHFMGESAYNDQLESVVSELEAKGLLELSEGALVVFPPGHVGRDGTPLPLIVRKADGGYGYAATDLATIRDRVGRLAARRLAYVVGAPQRQHLQMVFDVARAAGWLPDDVRVEHVAFGSVLGTDNKMLRTRAGASIRLMDLVEEAIALASDALRERRPELAGDELREAARAIGIGAIKYADLSTDRVRDYVFDYDRMLAFEGNTGPYLQYACVRVRSLLEKAGDLVPAAPPPLLIAHPAERSLALALLELETVVAEVTASLELHRLANHLYEVASRFSDFYERCPILPEPDAAVRDSRLALSRLTGDVLVEGLSLLGIRTPARM